MIQHEDGTVSLEGHERIDLQREIDWIVNDWLPDDYAGALVYQESGRAAGYVLYPYKDRLSLKAS